MRRVPVTVALFLSVALLASCGDDGEAPPVAAPTSVTPSSTTATHTAVPPSSTATPTPTASEPEEPTVMRMLRADGLGPARFGEPVDEALPELVAVLGVHSGSVTPLRWPEERSLPGDAGARPDAA